MEIIVSLKPMKEKAWSRKKMTKVIKNLKATNKLPHLMEDIPIPGLMTIYIDPEVRTSEFCKKLWLKISLVLT